MRLIGRKQVEHMTGFGKTHIYKEIKLGRFPRQRRFGKAAVRWVEEEVQDWMKNPIRWMTEPKEYV